MSGSKKTTKGMKGANLTEAIERFVTHLLDAATDHHVVLGPVLWRPDSDDRGKLWYFTAACGADGFRCDRLETDDLALTEQARALFMMVMVEKGPRVLHDVGDELAMARLCAVLWPSPRTRALLAAVERERAKS